MSERLYKLLEAIERALTRCASEPSHPVAIRILNVRREGRHLVVQRETPDGISLSALLRQKHALPFDEVIEYLRPLAAGIDHAAGQKLPTLDATVSSVFVSAPRQPEILPKTPPLALTVLNQLKDMRQEGKTIRFDPLRIEPDLLETQSFEQGVVSLARLAFELLKGRPAALESAEYRPIAPLSEEGNLCLRRALEQSTAFATASSFVEELANGGR